jgi:hypothetical protein
MTLNSVSSQSIQTFHEESAELLAYTSASWLSSKLLIDLIEGNYENSSMWPKAYESLKKTALATEALLKEMHFQPKCAIESIEKILSRRTLCVYTFTHSKDFIENPALLKRHLLAQIEKNKPFAPSVLASLLFVAATVGKYPLAFQKSCINPPSVPEKTVAIQAYRAGVSFRALIDWVQLRQNSQLDTFKKELSKRLLHFARELTLYYQSLELLQKPSASSLLESQ